MKLLLLEKRTSSKTSALHSIPLWVVQTTCLWVACEINKVKWRSDYDVHSQWWCFFSKNNIFSVLPLCYNSGIHLFPSPPFTLPPNLRTLFVSSFTMSFPTNLRALCRFWPTFPEWSPHTVDGLYSPGMWVSQLQTLCYAKSLQSCPTLWDHIDSSPPGSPVPGILQARTLEWVAISFSNAWKWKVKVKSLSCAQLLATPWIAA